MQEARTAALGDDSLHFRAQTLFEVLHHPLAPGGGLAARVLEREGALAKGQDVDAVCEEHFVFGFLFLDRLVDEKVVLGTDTEARRGPLSAAHGLKQFVSVLIEMLGGFGGIVVAADAVLDVQTRQVAGMCEDAQSQARGRLGERVDFDGA